MTNNQEFNLEKVIENKIFVIRGKKVMLDSDLAKLYNIETKQLKRAVNRNTKRFPEDFMFVLTKQESQYSRCQIGTLNRGTNVKYLPYAFTEHGVLMLSSVLNSERAIMVNIQIMRTFTKLREVLINHHDLQIKIEKLLRQQIVQSSHLSEHDRNIAKIFTAIKQLFHNDELISNRLTYEEEKEKNRKWGFQPPQKDK